MRITYARISDTRVVAIWRQGRGKKCCLVVYSLGAVGLYVLVILCERVCKRGKENYAIFFFSFQMWSNKRRHMIYTQRDADMTHSHCLPQ